MQRRSSAGGSVHGLPTLAALAEDGTGTNPDARMALRHVPQVANSLLGGVGEDERFQVLRVNGPVCEQPFAQEIEKRPPVVDPR